MANRKFQVIIQIFAIAYEFYFIFFCAWGCVGRGICANEPLIVSCVEPEWGNKMECKKDQ